MAASTPPSLSRFCRQALPLLLREVRGKRMLAAAAEVVETDRWNSFDRFHQTTATLVRHYEDAGAQVEVDPIQTGGWIGSGRWVIQEAADVHSATVDIVHPVRQRLLDYRDNPWHVVQWSSGTPRGGMVSELVILDSEAEILACPRGRLEGKIVLTRLSPRELIETLADRGAAGVITDLPVTNLPDAVTWMKFGWGGVPMDRSDARLVGLVISANQGAKLRHLAQTRGPLSLRTKVDVRKYVGTHDVVSGIVRGASDPQDEVWALAHSSEPGAVDNASGGVLCLEIARVLEDLIARGALPRPRRTIRLLSGYECYGFFGYLERTPRLQPPLAGACLDTLGTKPAICDGRIEWHATIPMSAGFVDWVGERIIRAALRRYNPGYRLFMEPFVSTADTLIGDPHYGFPCPWLTTHHRADGRGYDAYHSSADTLNLLSAGGLKLCAAAMAAYLYFLANAGSREVVELATAETGRRLRDLDADGDQLSAARARWVRDAHHVSMQRLQRWLWGGDRGEILAHLGECESRVAEATQRATRSDAGGRTISSKARRVPRRTALLTPAPNNTPPAPRGKDHAAGLDAWSLFWADGRRSLAEIAAAVSCEESGSLAGDRRQATLVTPAQTTAYFERHAQLGYVELVHPRKMVTRRQLTADLKKLGVRPAMDVMVHSSLSRLGYVQGGADTVIEALLAAIGDEGNLLMPSFNHRSAQVYNPMTTPTTNGAIPDAMWRRPDAVRSLHPTHAVAAIGPGAQDYCRDHLEVGIWAQDSPIGRLVHDGGYILSLGVGHHTTTACHVAETSMPCGCLDPFGNVDRVVMPDGSVQEVRGLAWREAACPVSVDKLEQALNRRGLQRRGRVGEAPSTLVKALDLWEVRRAHIRNACPTCAIKPA